MSTYISFAILGAGLIGTPAAELLFARGASVTILSRLSPPCGAGSIRAKVAKIDDTKTSAIIEVLREHQVDVVVSAVTIEGMHSQYGGADAAKSVGGKSW